MRGIPDPGRASRAVGLIVQTAAAPRVRTVDAHTGTIAVTDGERRAPRPLSAQPPPAQCGLIRHYPGRRVQFTRWNTIHNRMEVVRGEVLAHSDRTVTIVTDAGEEIWTSCGHVIEAR